MIRRVLASLLTVVALSAAHAQDDDLPIVAGPEILTYVTAELTPEALAAGLGRTEVQLLVELDEQGAVTYVEVMEGAGYGVDEVAMEAVRQMRFTPARTSVGPVGVAFPFTYVFEPPPPPPPAEPAPAKGDKGATASGREAPPRGDDVDPADLPILQGPAIAEYVEATYPPEAEAQGIEGEVTLMVSIDDTGAVTEAVVTGPAGQGFDEAAVGAVQQMRFTPAQTAEGPVGVVFEFTYAFTLTPEEPEEELPPPVNVEGLIRQMGTRTPLGGVAVVVAGTELSATTDDDGRFELAGVPEGPQTLRLLHPDHVTLEQSIEVTPGEIISTTLWMRALSYRDNEAIAYYREEKQEVTKRTLTIAEVKRIPGTFGDPVKVIQTLPGAARSPFGTGLLIIRGANPEDTAVYVDGVRIPIVYHLTGTTSVLSPEIVQSVDYLPGGYGVQYGRAQAGTVDVKTKTEFDDSKLVWGTDILDTQLWYEGNLGKNKQHGLALGVRRSYIDVFIPIFTPPDLGFTVRPVYWDYQAKWIPKLGENDDFSVFVYGFYDIITLEADDDQAVGTDQDTQGNFKTEYQSHRIVAHWNHRFDDNLSLDIWPSFGVDINEIGVGDGFRLFNRNFIFQLRAEMPWQAHPAVQIVPGLDFIGGPYSFEFNSPLSFADLGDPLAERDPVGFDGKGSAWSPTPYVKLNIRPLGKRDQWLITPGMRFNNITYVVGGSIAGEGVEPTRVSSVDLRLATRLKVFDKDDQTVSLKASSGTFHQAPQPFESIGIGETVNLRAERSWNSSLGIEHQISPVVSWDLEGFYRSMDNLVIFSDLFGAGSGQPFTNGGEGYAAGFEVIVRHAPANKFFGWISYTFSRSFRRDSPDDEWTRFDFDQPHIFSAQGGYDLPRDWGVSAQIQVVSGNPTSPFNAGIYDVDDDSYQGFRIGPANSERLPTFVQTSFRVDKTFTFRKWQLVTYLDLINAIRGVNPEATTYNYDFSESALVRGFPFIPNLGLEFTFHP